MEEILKSYGPYLLFIVIMFFMMRGGGCCGGHHGHNHNDGHSEHDGSVNGHGAKGNENVDSKSQNKSCH